MTEEQRAEVERAHLQAQVIEAQQAALRELSTPLIPLSENVVLMPLIGSIDTQRAQMVMEALLEGVAAYQADIALLDITGVQVVDTQVANALIHAAQAVKLLGARVILTGIGSPMAQTLVHLGVDLSDLMTMSSLQMGVAYALLHTSVPQK
jgi:rsbT co-antagonist protein RsbR